MKLTALVLLSVLLYACTPILSRRVNISGRNIPLEKVFTEISRQTGIVFFYESITLKHTRPVTLHVQQMPVKDVMRICLKGQGLGFSMRNRTIVIFQLEDRLRLLPFYN